MHFAIECTGLALATDPVWAHLDLLLADGGLHLQAELVCFGSARHCMYEDASFSNFKLSSTGS
jgi:hypothetical protein